MVSLPRTLFIIHRFDTKSLEDSAGVIEVMRPMLASGLIGEHLLLSLGRDTADYRGLIEKRVSEIAEVTNGQAVVIYGAGAHTRQFMPELERLPITALADRDQSLHGTERLGLPVIPPQNIPAYAKHVVVSSRAYEEGILADLDALLGSDVTLHTLYGRNPDGELRAQWEQEILDTVRDFQPDLLVHTPVHPHENLTPELFMAARALCPNMKIVTVWWDYDEQALAGSYLDYERESLEWADLVIENSNGTRLARMRANQPPYEHHRHTEKVVFHPTIFDPAIFYPEPNGIPRYEIALFGSSVGRRRGWIDLLKSRYGDRFHHLGGVYEQDRAPLPIADYANALRHTKICINTQTYPFRSQCKGKVREALGCGVLLLEEDNPETRLLLAPGEGIEYFDSPEKLFSLIDCYLADDKKRQQTVIQGQKAWITRMNPLSWTKQVFELLSLGSKSHYV